MKVKVRGIYATALTRLFLEKKVPIVQPSAEIRERFPMESFSDADEPTVLISDRDDRMGVIAKGNEEDLDMIAKLMDEVLPDLIRRKKGIGLLELEFPFQSKGVLDTLRNRVLPTLIHHHRLKIVDSSYVELIEKFGLSFGPNRREKASKEAIKRLIWDKLERGKEVLIEHVKVDGAVLYLSEGEIIQADQFQGLIIMKRKRFKGRGVYDGLGVTKEEGDYAVTEVREGQWSVKHTYFRRQGEKIGEYWNVNTPVEVYPDRIRYVDLEIDVVRWPDGRVEITDEEVLRKRFEEGYVSKYVFEKALAVAKTTRDALSQQKELVLSCPESMD